MSWKGSWGGSWSGGAQQQAPWTKGAAAGKANGNAATSATISPKIPTQQALGKAGASSATSAGAAKGAGILGTAKGATSAGAATAALAALKASLAKHSADFDVNEKPANAALEAAKKVMDNEKATASALKSSLESVEKSKTKLTELQMAVSKDVAESKKAGPLATACSRDLTALLEKCRSLAQQATIVFNKLKPLATKAQHEADLKIKETKDAAAFKPVIAKATKDVAAVEDAMKAVDRKAAPAVANPPEGEELDTMAEGIQTAAAEAMKKLNATKVELTEKFKTIAQYAPEAKKAAHAALADLQKKLLDCSKKGMVYQNFKKELPKLATSKKAVDEIEDLLAGHDTALTKARKLGDMANLNKDKIDAIDCHLEPIQSAIKEALSSMAEKRKGVDAASQVKLDELKQRAEDTQKQMNTVYSKIKGQRDIIRSGEYVITAKEKLQLAEEGWEECQEAEMPFLTGVEVLPGEQNDKALEACDNASNKSTAALNEARNFVKTKIAEAKGYEKELGEKNTAALSPLLKSIQEVEIKVNKFKKEVAERRVTSIMTAVLQTIDPLEKKITAAETEAADLASGDLEEQTEEKITAAIEKGKAGLAEATNSLTETKKLFAEKQKEAKASPKEPATMSISARLTAAQEKLGKVRASIMFGEKLVKIKKVIATGEEKVKEAEAEVDKVKQAAAGQFTVESVKTFADICVAALAIIKAVATTIQPHVAIAPPGAKATLQGLIERKVAAQKAVDETKAETKDAREEVLTDSLVNEGEEKTKVVETAEQEMETAEKPFLTGENLALKESLEAIKKCEEAVASVKKAAAEASKHIDLKSKEVKSFGEASVAKAKEAFDAMTGRVKEVQAKLVSFEKDLKERTKSTRMLEAEAKVDELEAQMKKTVASAEPFTKEGAADMSETDAAPILKQFMDAEKDTNKMLTVTKTFVAARLTEHKGNTEQIEAVKKLQERISKIPEEVRNAKKATAAHEKRALGTILVAEAKEQVGSLDEEVKKISEAAAPLLEHGGVEFLIGTSIKTLVAALVAHMKEKELAEDTLFSEINSGKSIPEKDFVQYLAKLPEAINHDELSAFSDERRTAIFKRLSADGKEVSAADFKGLLKQPHTCLRQVALNNQFDVEGSETLCKIEPNIDVVLFGLPKEDENGLLRSECTAGEHTGWVTIKQKDKGEKKIAPVVTFLTPTAPLQTFYQKLDKALKDSEGAVTRVTAELNMKMKKAAGTEEGPLKDAREEIAKMKEKVTESQKSIADLKKKVVDAKRDIAIKEKSEVNAHIEARNLKEAAPFLEGPTSKFEALAGAAKTAEEAGAPIVSLSGEELEAFATPATVIASVEKANAAVAEKVVEVKEAIKEQQKAAGDVNPQTGGTAEAKKQLSQLLKKVEEASRRSSKTLATAKGKCATLVNPKLDIISAAIRKNAQEKNLSGEALFDSLKDGEKIPEEAFCKLVAALEGLSVSPEIAKLVCQKIEKDGISKDTFLNYVVVYYKVAKTIAFTDTLDISKCKTLRKAAIGEIIEMLEGPVKDEPSGITRIRAKALKTPACEGWVTLSGNQGSDFLERAKKP